MIRDVQRRCAALGLVLLLALPVPVYGQSDDLAPLFKLFAFVAQRPLSAAEQAQLRRGVEAEFASNGAAQAAAERAAFARMAQALDQAEDEIGQRYFYELLGGVLYCGIGDAAQDRALRDALFAADPVIAAHCAGATRALVVRRSNLAALFASNVIVADLLGKAPPPAAEEAAFAAELPETFVDYDLEAQNMAAFAGTRLAMARQLWQATDAGTRAKVIDALHGLSGQLNDDVALQARAFEEILIQGQERQQVQQRLAALQNRILGFVGGSSSAAFGRSVQGGIANGGF